MFVPSLIINLRRLPPVFAAIATALAAFAAVTVSAQDTTVMIRNSNWASLSEPARQTWNRIEADTYAQKADFSSGYAELMNHADRWIRDLDQRRATIPETDLQDWDAAMKDLRDARSDMSDKLTQVRSSNADFWDDAKEKATDAWQRVQDDFDKVLHSTTS